MSEHLGPGVRIGRWVVIARGPSANGATWFCRCDCGTERAVPAGKLRRNSRSCGCAKGEHISAALTRHGHASHVSHGATSPTWRSWSAMRKRCSDPKVDGFENYGGRGIAVCSRWASFEAFLEDMGDRPPGTTLDRKDSNGNYEPGNCRWATPKEQAANRRAPLKLDDVEVSQIRWLCADAHTPRKAVASAFDVSLTYVHGIVQGACRLGAGPC